MSYVNPLFRLPLGCRQSCAPMAPERQFNGKLEVIYCVGGVTSPLLANIYLNPLDHGVNQKCVGQARMFRYADDFVIACRRGRAGEVRERTQRRLETRGLKLNAAKTSV